MNKESTDALTLSDRRCALQALYQLDAGQAASSAPGASTDWLVGVIADDGDAEDAHAIERGMALAALAWEFRNQADAEIALLTEEWPPYRQPVVDRSLLRMGWYEIRQTSAPPAKVINDAVELAKQFGAAESSKFVNAVLDRLWKGASAVEG